MFVTAGTPKEIVSRLNAEVFTKEGTEPVGSSPQELAAYFTREVDKYAKVIKAAQIRFE